jgi:hypothetical protein
MGDWLLGTEQLSASRRRRGRGVALLEGLAVAGSGEERRDEGRDEVEGWKGEGNKNMTCGSHK